MTIKIKEINSIDYNCDEWLSMLVITMIAIEIRVAVAEQAECRSIVRK